ncbi:acetyltransferase (GNAT) family domain-containing protein [Ditylenchus destructor]|uniref:Acetyltransferase (GNAT) family domain-containing protein n=1 Tax=Ditylenchus destructor TaxID=166010 RepID=A0AAD4NEL6_9BILA|nr:acetyltransferase (GNAT) family domain-containing protein [Ditylenchus destructor]
MNLERFEIVRNPGKDAYIDLCHEVNKYENWICGKEDYECWEKSFEDNFEFLIVYEKGTQNVVASAMLITVQSHGKSTPEFSGFGFFFVTPKHRGTGVGKALSEKLLKTDKFVNTNGFLISAPEMSEKYAARHGFDKIPEWHHQIYAIKTTDITELTVDDTISDTIEIRIPLEEDWEKIFEYNATIASGVHFDVFLKNWLTAKGTNTVVIFPKLQRRSFGFSSLVPVLAQYSDMFQIFR